MPDRLPAVQQIICVRTHFSLFRLKGGKLWKGKVRGRPDPKLRRWLVERLAPVKIFSVSLAFDHSGQKKNHPQREIILNQKKTDYKIKKIREINLIISNIFYGLRENQNTASDGWKPRAQVQDQMWIKFWECGYFNIYEMVKKWIFFVGISVFIRWYVCPFQTWICLNWFDLHLAVLGVNCHYHVTDWFLLIFMREYKSEFNCSRF